MSFFANKPIGDGSLHPNDTMLSGRAGASAPAFQPKVRQSVRLHPILAGSVAALVFVAMVGYGLRMPLLYEASSRVYADPAAAKILSDKSAAPFDAIRYDAFLAEQMDTAQRLDVVKSAIAGLPPATWGVFGQTEKRAASNIQAGLKVARVPSSYQISISLQGSDPAKTADMVNAVTSAYLDAVHRTSSQESDQRVQILTDERQRIDAELQAARTEQASLGASIGVASAGTGGENPYDQQLSGIRAELIAAREAHDVAAAQLAALSGVGPSQASGLTAAADELIATDAGLSSMKATISQRRAMLSQQMSGLTPNNPIYKQDQDEIAAMDRTLNSTVADLRTKAERRLQARVKSDLERTGNLESRLNGELDRQIAKATSAAPKLQRATEVAADIQRLDERQAAVDDALRGLRLQSAGPAQVRLAEAAVVPETPVANRRKFVLLMALPLALLFGIGAAVLARKGDTRIYGGPDIQELLGFPPLAILPARRDVSSRVFEEYVLRLAAGIESAYKSGGARTFLLTAVSLSTDIDPVTTALARKFKELGVDVVVANTADVLAPVERSAASRGLLVTRDGFVAANMARIKTEHGLALIQSEALLNCAQTEYVARCADATILIVEYGVTTRQELLEAASLLQRLNVTGIGAVLEELQLRFAEPSYRLAVEALDRRQLAEPPRQEKRSRMPVPEAVDELERPEAYAEPEFVAAGEVLAKLDERPAERLSGTRLKRESRNRIDELEAGVALEPMAYAEPVAQVEPAVAVGVAPPVSVAAEPVERAATEPRQAASVPTAPAAAAQTEHEFVPAVEQTLEDKAEANGATSPATVSPITVSPGTVRRGFAGLESRPPVLLPVSGREQQGPESLEGTQSNQGGGWTGLPDKAVADEETPAPRTVSWLDRLLGRSAGPAYSILVPKVEQVSLKGSPHDEEQDNKPLATRPLADRASGNQDDLDLPVLARLAHVTGSSPLAAPANPRPSDLTRLRIVPPDYEPHDAFGESALDSDGFVQEGARAVEPSSPAVTFQSAFIEMDAILPEAAVEEPTAHNVEETVREAATEEAATVMLEPLTAPEPAVDTVRGPWRTLPLEQIADQAPAAGIPAEVAVPEPEAVPVAMAPVEPELAVAPELAIAGELPVVPAPEPSPEPVEVSAELSAPSVPVEMVEADVPEAISVESSFAAPAQPAPEPVAPGMLETEPLHEELAESDDIVPVYREASRHLTTGRWDPIPPLRPTDNGWRGPSTPVPPTNATGHRRRWSDFVQQDVEVTGNQWIPSRAPRPLPPTDSLPERMLTRQWGLLSRFQQARNLSGGLAVENPKPEIEVPVPQESHRD